MLNTIHVDADILLIILIQFGSRNLFGVPVIIFCPHIIFISWQNLKVRFLKGVDNRLIHNSSKI